MKVSRRKFIALAPIAAGAVLQLRGSVLGQRSERPDPGAQPLAVGAADLATLSWASFYPFINTDFTFGQGASAVSLRLVDMTDSRPASTGSAGENFVLKFQGPFDKVLRQGTYNVDHFRLGSFQLFITDGGAVKRKQYYVAVINRVLS